MIIFSELQGCRSQPLVDTSALDRLTPEQALEPMDFFDALEQQPVACFDDVLHGVLILSPDGSPATFEERVQAARELKLIVDGPTPQRRAPVVARDVADIMLRALGARRTDNALAWVQSQWFVRPELRADEPLSGGELLAALTRLRDEIVEQARLGRAPLSRATPRGPEGGEFYIDLPPLPAKRPGDEPEPMSTVPAGEAQNSPNIP